MNGVAFMLPIALGMGLLGLAAFFWSLKGGQYGDLDGAAARILIDEDEGGDGHGEPDAASGTRP
ncbi:MAG: cbb3-type cytochrome oxidase assembly protein CcoS [Novosphingobium meiothermophilum]